MIDQNPPVDSNRHVMHYYSYDCLLNRVATCIDCGVTRQVSRKNRIWYIYPDGRVSSNEPSCTVEP